ncbi:MAG: penicillin-binding protein activator [Geminicoccaceae bacterium]|nr:penicillin-binding protein activator [Geminicoccaceae bacterium]
MLVSLLTRPFAAALLARPGFRPPTRPARTLAFCLAALLTACVPQKRTTQPPATQPVPEPPIVEAEPVPSGPVKVALLLPLSGRAADQAEDMLNAALMALFDVGDSDMVLMPIDTGGTPEGAREATRRAIAQDAELILGPLFSTSVAAAAPIARAADLKIISFSSDARVAGDDVWILGFRPEEQVERVVEYARSRGLRRIAALAPDDAYGAQAIAAWREATGGDGDGGRPLYGFYPSDENEAGRVVRELTRYDARRGASGSPDRPATGPLPFDALLLADSGSRLRSIAALLAYYDVEPDDLQLLGTMFWQHDPRLMLEPAFQGGWLATVAQREDASFSRNFQQMFATPPDALAGLAYDATALAAVVAASDRSFATAQITDPAGFIGRAGIFRLREDGLADHALDVVEVDAGNLVLLDEAPRSFFARTPVQ